MNKNNPKIEGPFVGGGGRYPDYLNKCSSCGEKVGKESKEYRRTLNEETFNKTGGREGRIYYCVPCGERISIEEGKEWSREREEYNKKEEQSNQKIVADCLLTINSLTQKLEQENVAGTVKDYKTIKNVEKRIKNLGNFKSQEVENLKKTCLDLINTYISPKDRKIGNSKSGITVIHPICCSPRNIKLEEDEAETYYYCDYCWETESSRFLISLKNYHIDKLNKTMLDNGVSIFELNSPNYQSMLTVPDFVLTQDGIQETYQKVEQDLQDFLNKKGIDFEKSNQIKSNQIKSNQIKSNLQHFQSNSISAVELTPQGDLLIIYQSGKNPSTLKNTDITSNPQLQNLKNTMVKNKQKKLTKEELEQQLQELEEQKRKLERGDKNKEQKPKDSGLGLKIGIGVLVVVVLVSLVVIITKAKERK